MTLTIRQLHPLFAGEVSGNDLADPASDAHYPELQAALDRYAVLVFHGVPLSQQRQVAFCGRFGRIEGEGGGRGGNVGVLSTGIRRRVVETLADISDLDEAGRVLPHSDRRRMFALANQLWHTDSSFKKIPAKYSMLHTHSVTPEGGGSRIESKARWHDLVAPESFRRVTTARTFFPSSRR